MIFNNIDVFAHSATGFILWFHCKLIQINTIVLMSEGTVGSCQVRAAGSSFLGVKSPPLFSITQCNYQWLRLPNCGRQSTRRNIPTLPSSLSQPVFLSELFVIEIFMNLLLPKLGNFTLGSRLEVLWGKELIPGIWIGVSKLQRPFLPQYYLSGSKDWFLNVRQTL